MERTFRITIHCDNAAFEGNVYDEIAAVLTRAHKKHQYSLSDNESDKWSLFDSNGNHVGFAVYTVEEA